MTQVLFIIDTLGSRTVVEKARIVEVRLQDTTVRTTTVDGLGFVTNSEVKVEPPYWTLKVKGKDWEHSFAFKEGQESPDLRVDTVDVKVGRGLFTGRAMRFTLEVP
jgi:hypothetical protein